MLWRLCRGLLKLFSTCRTTLEYVVEAVLRAVETLEYVVEAVSRAVEVIFNVQNDLGICCGGCVEGCGSYF